MKQAILQKKETIMYLHIGKGLTLRQNTIIAILDADNATRSVVTKKFLSDAERCGRVWSTDGELPRSLIVYNDPATGDAKICMSSLSAQTLEGRLHATE